MNTFKRKALLTAVLAGLGAAGTAEAYLDPNVTGQTFKTNYQEVMVQTYVEAVSKNNLGAVRENRSGPVGNLKANVKTSQGSNLHRFGGLSRWESTAADYKAATS